MNLQEELKALKERIAELEEQAKEGKEFPQVGDNYSFINSTGKVVNEKWGGLSFEIDRLKIGNIFKIEEEAEFAFEKLKVEAELRKFSIPFDKMSYNFFITYNESFGILEVVCYSSTNTQGAIYFESKDKAQQAIQAVGKERIKKYIFGVE